MKVVFATGIFPPDIGGPATYVDGLGRELAGAGIGIEVVTYGEPRRETAPFPVARISRSRSLPMRYLSFLRATRRSLSRGSVAYLQDPISAGLPATLAALSKRTPSVVKVVGDLAWEIARERGLVEAEIEAFQRGRYNATVERLRAAERFVARRAARIVTPSDFLKGIVAGWGVDVGRIEVIENAVRLPETCHETRDAARQRLGLVGDPVLATAGRMVPWKGFDRLTAAMPEIVARYPAALLVIAGSGPGEEALRRQIETLGLDGRVRLAGTLDRDGVALLLRASDIFVLASTYEGFSHVLLEAMLAERPVVASRVGGNPELIEDGEHGLLVEPQTAEVVRAVLRLLEDRELKVRLAREGRERAKTFRWEAMVARTTRLLQEVAERASKSSR